MNFLVGAQLPPALARWLTEQGHQAVHVERLGLLRAEDAAIWKRALDDGLIIVTKDEDFVDRWLVSSERPVLVWIRRGNCSNQALIAWLQPLWPEAARRLEQGDQLVELRA